ncbi:hypothetical protein JKP88DRAFT_245981 [Tribonema minus]|uniref:Uncharacterized protein n=1 Tax=Tribonema minus TaxID=303371 RepID=A0A835YUZ2_9STRA|nr:hypothetical protein JKP88DRAFT_245981 [Tribonema minus]
MEEQVEALIERVLAVSATNKWSLQRTWARLPEAERSPFAIQALQNAPMVFLCTNLTKGARGAAKMGIGWVLKQHYCDDPETAMYQLVHPARPEAGRVGVTNEADGTNGPGFDACTEVLTAALQAVHLPGDSLPQRQQQQQIFEAGYQAGARLHDTRCQRLAALQHMTASAAVPVEGADCTALEEELAAAVERVQSKLRAVSVNAQTLHEQVTASGQLALQQAAQAACNDVILTNRLAPIADTNSAPPEAFQPCLEDDNAALAPADVEPGEPPAAAAGPAPVSTVPVNVEQERVAAEVLLAIYNYNVGEEFTVWALKITHYHHTVDQRTYLGQQLQRSSRPLCMKHSVPLGHPCCLLPGPRLTCLAISDDECAIDYIDCPTEHALICVDQQRCALASMQQQQHVAAPGLPANDNPLQLRQLEGRSFNAGSRAGVKVTVYDGSAMLWRVAQQILSFVRRELERRWEHS